MKTPFTYRFIIQTNDKALRITTVSRSTRWHASIMWASSTENIFSWIVRSQNPNDVTSSMLLPLRRYLTTNGIHTRRPRIVTLEYLHSLEDTIVYTTPYYRSIYVYRYEVISDVPGLSRVTVITRFLSSGQKVHSSSFSSPLVSFFGGCSCCRYCRNF